MASRFTASLGRSQPGGCGHHPTKRDVPAGLPSREPEAREGRFLQGGVQALWLVGAIKGKEQEGAMTKRKNERRPFLTVGPSWGSRGARMWAGVAASLLIMISSWPSVALGAGVPSAEERLVEAQLDYERARGLGEYVALRRIWQTWEEADPRKVEAALRLSAEREGKSEAVRAYARVLAAYARVRRGDRAAAERSFEELGFLRDFFVVGPFDNEGKLGFLSDFEPDAGQAEPIVPGQAFSGKERPVRWRKVPDVFHYGWIDFGSLVRPQVNVCAFATTFVSGGKTPRTVLLWAGSRGAIRVQVNGQTILEDDAYRAFDSDRLSGAARLLPGENRITVKVCGDDAAPLFALRLTDERGRPDPELRARADVQQSEAATENVRLAQASAPALPALPRTLRAPLVLVKEIADSARSSASDLEMAAQYLVLTQGDDHVRHQARDLITAAADKQPTARRKLLQAELSEDRNKARLAIDAAQELAGEHDIEVLLARARHLRSGPSPREAFEYYDRVLTLDPDNIVALEGRVDLENAAGLKRSALSVLEAAYMRRPHSVLLGNMVASQRAALGLSTEALEAEDRYAALRADDTSYLAQRMELALSRRNFKDAEHFLGQLVRSEADSPFSYRLAARVHRAMGQEERAFADLETARAVAPDDIGVLQHLADLRGRAGQTREQLALLREVLRIRPQEVDVRQYVEHIEPPKEASDEKYAMPPREFLAGRHAPADGHPRRTLRDLTVSTVYENGLGTQFRQVVFQPLTDASAALSRQYAFQYQADRQRVELKGAKVYRADGRVDEAIESGEGAADDPSMSMYTSARTFYVQFPRLEPGDVVELRYRIDDVTPRNEFADYYGDIVYMQNDEPTSNAEYVLVTPKARKLLVDARVPNLKRKVSTSGDQRIYHFSADRVPAIKPEPQMPPWPEVLGFVHVSTYQDWNALGKWYWGLVKEQLDLDTETRKLARSITQGKSTELEKVQAVYNWVIKNTRYVALEFGIYGFKPRRCVQTVSRGWGDCKDKATVIVTLLRELGIDANLVIVRTGARGDFRSELASLAPFDHAIAYVPSLDLYLDGTAEYTGTFELPVMDRGALGLLVLDGEAKLVRLPDGRAEDDVLARNTRVTLRKDGAASLELEYDIRGLSAPAFRARYEAEATRKDRLATDLGGEFPGLEISRVEAGDLSDVERPVSLTIHGRVSQFARPEGSELSLPVTLNVGLTPRFASLSKRTQDVVIKGFSSRKETTTIKLPPGAKLRGGPPEQSGKSRFGAYSVRVIEQGNEVTVESSLALSVTRVKPVDYAAFRKFCQAVDEAFSHRLLVSP